MLANSQDNKKDETPAQTVWSRFNKSSSEWGCHMGLFLFAVGNFPWKSILLTQHNETDYLCLASPARKKRNAVIKYFYDCATPLAGSYQWWPSWMDHRGDEKGWIVKNSDQELKTTERFLIPKCTLSERREKSAWETLVISNPKGRSNSSCWIDSWR